MLKYHLLLNQKKTHDRYWWWMVYGKKCQRTTTIGEKKKFKKAQERQDEIQRKIYEANRQWNDWKFQLHWNKLEWVDTKFNPKIDKPFSVYSKTFYISKSDITAHCVGRSKLKELYINNFYGGKQMNEEMEAEFIKTDSRPDNLAVLEDASVGEAVPIDIRKERKTKSYKEKMIQDIKNIDTYKTRTKVNTTKWRPIYEVIYKACIKDSKIFLGGFIRDCTNNSN